MKFRKKPVEIEAVQWKGGVASVNEIEGDFGAGNVHWDEIGDHIYIATKAGIMEASVGDWIAKGFAEGLGTHFWIVEAESFEGFYEAVE